MTTTGTARTTGHGGCRRAGGGLVPPRAPASASRSARLDNGASVGFALLRSGGPAGLGGAIGDAALAALERREPRARGTATSGRVLRLPRSRWSDSDAARPFRVIVQAARPRQRWSASLRAARAPARLSRRRRRSARRPAIPHPQLVGEGECAHAGAAREPYDTARAHPRRRSRLSARAGGSPRRCTRRAHGRARGRRRCRRAEILGARGLYAEAAEEYKKALAVQPLDAGVHNKLGICHQYLQDEAMARREYERALELRPAYAEAWNNLGTLEQSQPTLQAGGARLQEGDRDQAHARDVLEERRSRLCGARADPGRIRGLP